MSLVQSSSLADTLAQVSAVVQMDSGENHQIWIGKDYYNTFIREAGSSDEPFTGGNVT